MIPAAFVAMERLPLNANGKVDRSVLPAPAAAVCAGYLPPRDRLELRLVQIWEAVLGCHPIGIADNFFELGGHSLLAVRLIAQIHQQLGYELRMTSLFSGGTVERQAELLREGAGALPYESLVAIQPQGSRTPLFCIHPGGGGVLGYLGLAHHLGTDQPVFGLQARGWEDDLTPLTTIEEMAASYLHAVIRLQAQGPYLLGGWSFGGLVAFEMAQQLRAQGEEVALVALLDASAEQERVERDDAELLALFLEGELPLAVDELRPLGNLDHQLAYVVARAQELELLPPRFSRAGETLLHCAQAEHDCCRQLQSPGVCRTAHAVPRRRPSARRRSDAGLEPAGHRRLRDQSRAWQARGHYSRTSCASSGGASAAGPRPGTARGGRLRDPLLATRHPKPTRSKGDPVMNQGTYLGLRSLFRRPALAFLIVLTLGLGMGVTTALFSLIDGVLLRPLAYRNPESLVWVYGRNTERDSLPLSPPDFLDYRSDNQVLSGIAAFQDRDVNLAGGDVPEHIPGAAVSSGFFQTLEVQPLAGRFFTDEEEKSGAQVVILSEDLWRRRFGASADAVGKTIQLDGKPAVVAGIMPASFRLPDRAQIWVPLSFSGDEMNIRRFHFLYAVARLKPGVTVQAAQANLDAIAARLATSFPDSNSGWKTRLVPLKDYVIGDVRVALLVLFGAVGIVLLIACANIASLLLVEGIARESEMAIRSALGASRLRLVGQLLAESLVLSVLGGAFGLLLATWSLRLLVALNPGNIPRLDEVHIAPTTFGFVCVVAVFAALVFGLVPALFSSRPNLQSTLRETGRNTTTSMTVRRLSRLLVVAEITLSTALLIGMGLLGKSFFQLSSVDPGFRDDNVLTAEIVLSSPRYTKPNPPAPFFQSLIRRLSAAPGVVAVGVVNSVPLSGAGGDVPFSIEGRPPASPDDQLFAFYRVASANYFKAMSIPLLRGRSFTENDSKNAPKVVIVDQTLAEGLWPGENPLGHRLRIDLGEPFVAEVIGVVGNIRHTGLDKEPFQTLYLSYLQDQWPNLNVVVRTSHEHAGVSEILRQAVSDLDPAQPVSIRSLREIVSKSVARPLFNMFLLSVFAVLALVLALVGVYGVISYSVSQRRNEIGIRVALGASPWDTFSLVLREGLLLTVLGIGLGLVFALAATRGIASLLYGVTNTDFSIYLGAALLVVLVTLVACAVPARRAARIDPLTAIREVN